MPPRHEGACVAHGTSRVSQGWPAPAHGPGSWGAATWAEAKETDPKLQARLLQTPDRWGALGWSSFHGNAHCGQKVLQGHKQRNSVAGGRCAALGVHGEREAHHAACLSRQKPAPVSPAPVAPMSLLAVTHGTRLQKENCLSGDAELLTQFGRVAGRKTNRYKSPALLLCVPATFYYNCKTAGWGKSRVTAVSTWSTKFTLLLFTDDCIVSRTNNRRPISARPRITHLEMNLTGTGAWGAGWEST